MGCTKPRTRSTTPILSTTEHLESIVSKRYIERRRHDERVAGRNVTIRRRMREESNDLVQCACHSVVRLADVKHCGSCGWDGCSKCQPGSICNSCLKTIGLCDDLDRTRRGCYEIDLDDDMGDDLDCGSAGQVARENEDTGEGPGNDYDADLDNGGPYPRPTNWDRFSDDMY